MKIRRFTNDQITWLRLAYVEYQDDAGFEVARDGGVTKCVAWSLVDAERLVAQGSWKEVIGPLPGDAPAGTAVAMPEVRSLHDQALFDFFREFRYATVTTGGVGNGTYSRALAWIDNEARIRVAEALKGKT